MTKIPILDVRAEVSEREKIKAMNFRARHNLFLRILSNAAT